MKIFVTALGSQKIAGRNAGDFCIIYVHVHDFAHLYSNFAESFKQEMQLSKDIGAYNTCPHLCRYCDANYSPQTVMNNFRKHTNSSESII